MFWLTSRRRLPTTFTCWSITARRRDTSSSVRSRTRVSREMPVSSAICCAVVLPIPKMYVSEISSRFSRGMSTPAIRAMHLPLNLLVARVRADDPHLAVAADHLAVLAHTLDRRSYLHGTG